MADVDQQNQTQQEHDLYELAPPEQAQVTNAEIVVEEEPEPSRALIERATDVPVNATGTAPENLGQLIDYAQYMAKAQQAIPLHLRNNVGACMAVIEISQKGGLSPYMVANKTYIQNDRLCFESQLFHAFLMQSGQLHGRLRVRYTGEGDQRRCIVSGLLRGETEPHELTSPTLKELHPGHTDKNGKRYVKGSPLWDKKPDVQLFYDTSRDWTRMYCPVAVLGIYTPEEMLETPLGPAGAIDAPVAPDLHKRLTASSVSREEGHQPGHAENELAHVAAVDKGVIQVATPRRTRRQRRKEKIIPAAQQETPEKAAEPAVEAKPEPPKTPSNPAEYDVYFHAWLGKSKSRDDAYARYEGEHELRDTCVVPIKTRKKYEQDIADKFSEE